MPDLDERLEHLIGELAAPVETAGAVERVHTRVQRHQRQRRLVAGGALVAVAAATFGITQVVGSRDRDRDRVVISQPDPAPTTTTPAPTTTTPAPPDPAVTLLTKATAAWPIFVATLPNGTVASEVAASPDGPVAVTAGDEDAIRLYRFVESAGWSELARFATYIPLAPSYSTPGHFAVEDVTGDGQADFVVIDFPGADHVGGAVLGADGGDWHLLPFEGLGWNADTAGSQPPAGTFVTFLSQDDTASRARYGSVLQTLDNDCTPSCADGTFYEDHWRFDGAKGMFVSVDRHVRPRPTSTTPQPR